MVTLRVLCRFNQFNWGAMKRIAWMIAVTLLPAAAFADVLNNPRLGRNYGVELNLLRMAGDSAFSSRSFSGTVSYFNHARNTEIALPFFYSEDDYGDERLQPFTLFMLDAHYRSFLGDTVNGFYISGFGRLARLHGQIGSHCYSQLECSSRTIAYDTETKFGIGVGIGYRIFLKNRFYWGISLSRGLYIFGENDKYIYFGYNEDPQNIYDIEILKFGYAF